MRSVKNAFSLSLVVFSLVLASASFADAQKRNEKEVRDALRSLNSNIDNFEYDLRYQMQSSSANSGDLSDVSDDIRNLKDDVSQFQRNFDQRRENRDDVNQIVDSARRIDQFVRVSGLNRRVTDDWLAVKKQIERLAANYGALPSWDDGGDPQQFEEQPGTPTANTFSVGLSGTYDLDTTRSESVEDIVTGTNAGTENRQDLKDKLEAPGQIAIEIRGNQVTLATSKASPVTFAADGSERREQGPNGKTIRLRATLNGETLTISSLGGDSDYTITFTSASNGQVLKVSRRITTDYLDQTVFAESVYNKTDTVARLGIDNGRNNAGNNNSSGGYSDNDQTDNGTNTPYGNPPTTSTGRIGEFVVPNGSIVTGILENEINTKVSQNNDRFRLTVQSPNEFRGAVIDGYITGVGRSGKVTGRSNVTFNFEKITLRDGKSYDFGGNLQSIKDTNGKTVKIDSEGTAKGGSQSKESVKRGGIGAGLGALIGAIAGGAKGAVIGAVIGGGAGAGSVAIQGREDLQLQKGSTMTIQSSSPIR